MISRLGLSAVAAAVLAGCGGDRPEPQAGELRLPKFGFTNVASNDPPVAAGSVVAAAQAKIAPGSIMRFTIQWRLVQPQPGGPFDFSRYDEEIVSHALAAGLRPLIVVAAAPEWAWGGEPCAAANLAARGYCFMPPGSDAASLDAWRRFVTEVARRYGEHALAIEVWNEPNGGGFWNTVERPSARHYAEVLCEAHAAIDSVAPDLPVISGGLATSFATDDRHVSSRDYLAELYESGGLPRCADGIGIHPYPGQESAQDPEAPFQSRLAEARAVREEHQDGMPLWITEFGYFTRGPGAVGEEEQARGLVCGALAAAAMPDVRAFVVHTLMDRGDAPTAEDSFGVMRAPPSGGPPAPKPAAGALAEFLAGRAEPC